jgi:CPA1 family monovalent cation:H+ antiporter
LLPILLVFDSPELKLADLKEHGLSLLYLAVITLLVSNRFFANYTLSFSVVIVLFAMVLATDPSRLSVFSKNSNCRTV